MFSKDNDEEHVIHLKRTNIKIMINDKADEVFFNHFFLDIKLSWKLYWKIVVLSLIVFIYFCNKVP